MKDMDLSAGPPPRSIVLDRMLIAQANAESLTLLIGDRKILRYEVSALLA